MINKVEVINLADCVSYQKGAVVSKTLIDKKIGTVTVFAFDQGQGLSEHTAPYDATVSVIDGEAEIVIDGSAYNVKAGEMVSMPANKPHSVKAVVKFKMMLIMIRA
ncbi:MAG: cupin domain-containing protein [Candidatus Omnitrophota bacterium]